MYEIGTQEKGHGDMKAKEYIVYGRVALPCVNLLVSLFAHYNRSIPGFKTISLY